MCVSPAIGQFKEKEEEAKKETHANTLKAVCLGTDKYEGLEREDWNRTKRNGMEWNEVRRRKVPYNAPAASSVELCSSWA